MTTFINPTNQDYTCSCVSGDLLSCYNLDRGPITGPRVINPLLVFDVSGNRGTYVGDVTGRAANNRFGEPASGIDFNGHDEYVFASGITEHYPSRSNLFKNSSDPFAVSAWIEPRRCDRSFNSIVEFADNALRRRGIGLDEENRPYIIYGDNKYRYVENFYLQTSLNKPHLKLWYHIIGSFDGSNPSIYVNGEAMILSSEKVLPPSLNNEFPNRKLRIADSVDGSNAFFDGRIDSVKIYSNSISVENAARLANDCPTPTQTPTLTQTPTVTPTNTQTPSNTATPPATPTQTPSFTPTAFCTPTNTASQTKTPTQTPTTTLTQTVSYSPTPTPTLTKTPTPTPTYTSTLTSTPTNTPSNTPTLTQTPSVTPSHTATPTQTPSFTPLNLGCCTPFSEVQGFAANKTHFIIQAEDKRSVPNPLRFHVNWGDGSSEIGLELPWDQEKGYYKRYPHIYSNTGYYTGIILIDNLKTNRSSICGVAGVNILTPTQTATQTSTPNVTPSVTQTLPATPTPTRTPKATPTATKTQPATPTATKTPPATPTATNTPTQTNTSTPTQTPTLTQTATQTPTFTQTNTQTNTHTPTQTSTFTATPTLTQTNTPTFTSTPTTTQTNTFSATPTYTATPTITQTQTYTPTLTQTPTPSCLTKCLNIRFQYGSTYVVEGQTTGVRVYREKYTCVTNNYTGPFCVDYRMEGQQYSATEDVDFIRDTGRLCFAEGENMKIIDIRTLLNYECEPSEFFNIYLENLQSIPCVEAEILYKNPYQVLITDTGCPPCPEKTPTATPTMTPSPTPTRASEFYDKYELCVPSGSPSLYDKYIICD